MPTKENHSTDDNALTPDLMLCIQQHLDEIRQAAQQLIKELNLPDDSLYEVLATMYQKAPGGFPLRGTPLECPDNQQE